MISNYTYQQIINSNMRSNMAPLMVSRGGHMGDTESGMPWEIGLSIMRGLEN